MILRHTAARVLALASLVLAAPAPVDAQACGCVCPADGSRTFQFLTRNARVPVNARLLVHVTPDRVDTVRLRRGERDFDVAVEPLEGVADWYSVTVAGGLEPDGVYDLEVGLPSGAVDSVRLTASEEADTNAPDASRVEIVNYFSDRSLCYDVIGAALTWETGAFAYDDHVVFDVEVSRGDEPLGRVILRRDARRFGRPADGRDGADDCLAGHRIDGIAQGESLTARVRVLDIAGNQSEYVVDFEPRLDEAIPPGTACPYCAAAPASDARPGVAGTTLLALILLAAWRRRA